MSTKINTVLGMLLLTIILAFLGANAIGVFVDLFWAADSKPAESFRGAFLGAFLAFIFIRLGEGLTRYDEVGRKHHRALVALQFEMNDCLNIVNDNVFILESWGRVVDRVKEKSVPPVFTSRLIPLPISREVLLDLTSLGLVNELYQMFVEFRKLNGSCDTWHRALDRITESFITKQIDESTYRMNLLSLDEGARVLKAHSETLMGEIESLIAAGRVMLSRRRTVLGQLYLWLNPDAHPAINGPARVAELRRTAEEVAEIQKESRKRIESITASQLNQRGDNERRAEKPS